MARANFSIMVWTVADARPIVVTSGQIQDDVSTI